ncbi:MAG: hypothetical protein Pars2KO_26700 [Parasphingorhabdus sp.]
MSDPVQIHNWLRLDDRITTSGQPSEEELAEIKALGIEHVINLALEDHEKSLTDERGALESLGVEYIHIPVVFSAPTEQDFQQFCDTMDRLDGKKVHVHCIVNARVSAFFYRYRTERLGLNEEKARADMNKIWDPADWKEVGKPWVKFLES